MKKKKGVTDHEFHRMEQWLNLFVGEKAREHDRQERTEWEAKVKRLREAQRRSDEMCQQIEEARAKRNSVE